MLADSAKVLNKNVKKYICCYIINMVYVLR